ncbi:MAG: multidrug transporter [Eubacteriales bacterium]|nr:multidrug transporter [Eubacteriales bacterium]
MHEERFTKKDWTLFREKIAGWQEAYMDRLNKEYIELLSGDAAPSEKFWALEKRIKDDKRKKGVRIQMSRSDLIYNILGLIGEGAITLDDLEEFSDELKEAVKFLVER